MSRPVTRQLKASHQLRAVDDVRWAPDSDVDLFECLFDLRLEGVEVATYHKAGSWLACEAEPQKYYAGLWYDTTVYPSTDTLIAAIKAQLAFDQFDFGAVEVLHVRSSSDTSLFSRMADNTAGVTEIEADDYDGRTYDGWNSALLVISDCVLNQSSDDSSSG